ncbi:MAG: hypothetical protein K2V38_20310, partial [Gemmataceae bacterium]|nr:hypothetical protein [Gemmataceae bacterium]
MSIVLSLTGRRTLAERLTRAGARDWLSRAAVWCEGLGDAVLDARVVRDGEDRPVLLVELHPAAPPVEVRLGAGGRVRVTAATTPAGPGYHIHLCDLFRQFAAAFAFPWVADDCTDPTGFFGTRDRAACERAFLRWLGDQCAAGGQAVAGALGDRGYTHPAEVLTPLGPRAHAWRAAVAA